MKGKRLICQKDGYDGDPPELKDILVKDSVLFLTQSIDRPWEPPGWLPRRWYPTDNLYPFPEPDYQASFTYNTLWDYAPRQAKRNKVSNVWAEFGVMSGGTARVWHRKLPEDGKLYLYDSFIGLPEQWNDAKAGHFTCNGKVPAFNDPRIVIKKGWFKDTLPLDDLLGFVHIDCDLYSSTKDALAGINVAKGTVILFDEFWGIPGWEENEYKALMEWDRPFKFLARDKRCRAVIEVL